MPFGMFPAHYHRGAPEALGVLRESARVRRIFLSGSLQDDTYNSKRMERRFNKMNRHNKMVCVQNGFGAVHVVDTVEALRAAAEEAYRQGLTLVDTAGVRIPEKAWLPPLAQSDFFLACVGASMPLSHNIIESMALGVIPITSYPEFFDPPLVEGETCLAFAGCDGLLDALTRADAMEPHHVDAMRQRVIAYYDTHLDPRRFVEQVERTPSPVRVGLTFCNATLEHAG